VVALQRAAGNSATARVLQRQGKPVATKEGDADLVRRLEQDIDAANVDAGQNTDRFLRASGSRESLLLRVRPHVPFETPAQVDEFVRTARRLARTEMDTLNEFGAAGAELVLRSTPKGFPLTWGGRVKAALSLGKDPAAILTETMAANALLMAQAAQLPARIVREGVPVPMADLPKLSSLELRFDHLRAAAGNGVGEFARAVARHAQFRFMASFAFRWEMLTDEVRGAVDDGTLIPSAPAYDDFLQNRQSLLRGLPTRAAERLAGSEAELLAIQRESIAIGDAALLMGMASGFSAGLSVLGAWQEGAALFTTAIAASDGTVASTGDGERIAMAFRWLWEAGYVGENLHAAVSALIAAGPEMILALALMVIAQMIPGVNVALDVYLAYTLGKDVLQQLVELGLSLSEVRAARSVLSMQRAAGRLSRILVGGGIELLTTLVTEGIARGARALGARAARLAEAEGLSEKEAIARAMRESPASERAALDKTADLSSKQLATQPAALRREFQNSQVSPSRRTLNDEVYDTEVTLANGHSWRRQRENGRWCRFSPDPLCFIFGEGPGGRIEVYPVTRKARQGFWSGMEGNSEFTPNDPVALRRTGGRAIVYRNGYPDFSPFAVDTALLPRAQLAIKDRELHNRLADAALARRRGWLLPNGEPDLSRAYGFRRNPGDPLTWHHVEGDNIMQLVPESIHRAAQHAGGFSGAE